MLNSRNVKHLFIGAEGQARTVGVSIDPSSAAYLAAGELVVTSPGGTVIDDTTAATANEIVIYQGRGAGVDVISPIIRKKNITDYRVVNGVAAAEEVWNIGYNGTSGSIEAINNNEYVLRLVFTEQQVMGHGQQRTKVVNYVSDANATQEEIANNLALTLLNSFSRDAQQDVRIDLLCNDAGTAIGAAADTVKGQAGTKTVTVVDVGANATVIAIAAGDYFRVGTATTAEVYKVVTSTVGTSGGVLTLDRPLNANVNLLGTTSEFITAANAATAAFGIKLTGLPRDFSAGVYKYTKVRFQPLLAEFGTTTLARATGAFEGTGRWEQIAELEFFVQGNEGNYYRSRSGAPVDPKRSDVYVPTGNLFDMFIISYYEETHGGIGAPDRSPKELIIAVSADTPGTAVSDATTGINAVLNVFCL
jgi:hypothetical protein